MNWLILTLILKVMTLTSVNAKEVCRANSCLITEITAADPKTCRFYGAYYKRCIRSLHLIDVKMYGTSQSCMMHVVESSPSIVW